MLKNKVAIIYGAGGSLGGAVSKALAREGVRLFLTGRNISSVQKIADEIKASGGYAEAAEVDALDEHAINTHIETVMQEAGEPDISFNAIGLQDTQNIPLVNMKVDDFTRPVSIAMQTHFLTATAAGRAMMKNGSGVILTLTATPGGIGYPNVGGFGPACCAIESFSRDLASELGPFGIRVVNIRSAGSPDSRVFREAIEKGGQEVLDVIKSMEGDTMLKTLPRMDEIANTAVFLASAMAGKITGITVDVTCGTTNGLNYKASTIPFGQL